MPACSDGEVLASPALLIAPHKPHLAGSQFSSRLPRNDFPCATR